jgi:hypothetical protein
VVEPAHARSAAVVFDAAAEANDAALELTPVSAMATLAGGSAAGTSIPPDLRIPACIDETTFTTCPNGSEQRVSAGERPVISCDVAGHPLGSRPEREGPSLWFREDSTLERAGRYAKHAKEGRWHYFYPDGRLEYVREWSNDKNTGLYLGCYSDGRVRQIVTFVDNLNHGLSRWWKPDGSLSYAFEYDHGKKVRQVIDADELRRLAVPPPGACTPKVCTMDAHAGS